MLICPQCEFENPDTNKFCQSCGTPLQSNCELESNSNSTFKIPTNLNDTVASQTHLWAIITKLQPLKLENNSNKQLIAANNNSTLQISDLTSSASNLESTETTENTPLQSRTSSDLVKTEQLYLDPQNRYRINTNYIEDLNNFNQSNSTLSVIEVAVIDEQIEQKTALATLQEQQSELFAELADNVNNSYRSVAQYWNLIGVPTQALPYLVLQKFTPAIPQIYDAWQYNEEAIVILPNRSNWLLLTELWNNPELPFQQILWFLNELAKLWMPLTEVGCSQSLLMKENLLLDEDQSVCLHQLYLNPPDTKPTLQNLVQTWQIWLQESGRQPNQSLEELIQQVIEGAINTVEQLSVCLQQLALENFDFQASVVDQTRELEPSLIVFEENELELFNEYEEDEELISHNDAEDQPTLMLPMQLAEVIDASCTDLGTQRDHNEDFFGVKTEIKKKENAVEKTISVSGLYIVCDGMGGHEAGEVASTMAVHALEEYFQTHWFTDHLPGAKTIEAGILLANQTLYQTNLDHSRSGNSRMGTTMVMALLQDTNLAIAHVGDSRIYRITRQRGLEQLTQDHEVGQREINRGVEPEIAYGRPDAYQLTQALGPRENRHIKPEIKYLEIQEDCLILLCSDGLSDNNLLENHWETYLTPLISSKSNLEEGLFQLIDFANQYNGHDNITGVLVRIKLKPHF
ncbi:protein serine/threonine phosphatase [Stanieria cyanosphaera PCC 7437]|uniref:Protein serine/threonine phosphatase n=1 Tax=Stanieria cyanosphaera (strain ATCC 29371 / PCC 7437) TaxID=111780 RepID=K9XWZ1_STAC7|nr:serine/threonine phosphatase [Stanieria cyanosphaera]AFZ36601.1 protein serine/threonine phosphatase [Stanieria cyanosphaera PCC 7437]